jgi:hypothetical protein
VVHHGFGSDPFFVGEFCARQEEIVELPSLVEQENRLGIMPALADPLADKAPV